MLRQLGTRLERGRTQSAAPRFLRMQNSFGALAALFIVVGVAVAQDRVSVTSGVPTFRVDPAWPSIPNNWQFGQVASVSVDERDHVWVLQRPGTLARLRNRV